MQTYPLFRHWLDDGHPGSTENALGFIPRAKAARLNFIYRFLLALRVYIENIHSAVACKSGNTSSAAAARCVKQCLLFQTHPFGWSALNSPTAIEVKSLPALFDFRCPTRLATFKHHDSPRQPWRIFSAVGGSF